MFGRSCFAAKTFSLYLWLDVLQICRVWNQNNFSRFFSLNVFQIFYHALHCSFGDMLPNCPKVLGHPVYTVEIEMQASNNILTLLFHERLFALAVESPKHDH